MPAYLNRSVEDFLNASTEEVLAALHRGYAADGFVSQYTTQTIAWESSLDLLRANLEGVAAEVPSARRWKLLLELPLYRLRRRIDAVLVLDHLVVVIEAKAGEDTFRSSDRRQVEEYALDLRDFHEPSAGIGLLPVLWCTGASQSTRYARISGPGVAEVHEAGEHGLAQLVVSAYQESRGVPWRVREDWAEGVYRPVPSVIEAATTLFAGHGVEAIAHADAANLGEASDHIVSLIGEARRSGSRALIFLTGVPGSGKTLAGLNVVHRAVQSHVEEEGDIVYLSGNTPLVTVLREALARDEHRRRKADGETVSKATIRNKVRARIQHIIDFLREYLTDDQAPPHEHAIVFDEAQRAWDARYGAQKFGRPASEPKLLLEIMARHSDWCALVGLVGGGQEINTGENGIAEWGDALRSLPQSERPLWKVFGPASMLQGDRSTAFLGLGDLPTEIEVVSDDALRLDVPLRTFRSPRLADWVAAVLDGDQNEALDIAGELGEYPIILTRDLDATKAYLGQVGRGERRYGLVASSGAARLRAEGLGVSVNATDGSKIAHWYLNPPGDVRSSFSLEVTANEYTTQGLELDYVGLCWGGDCLWDGGAWTTRQFRGTKWVGTSGDRRRFILNSYRVLLTRAREGIVIWVPAGDADDDTRRPGDLDRTAAFLKGCGARLLSDISTEGSATDP